MHVNPGKTGAGNTAGEYCVRMAATADTYEYDVVPLGADGARSYTFAQVREMFPDVRNNIDALIALREHGAEIIDKAVDTAAGASIF